MLAILKRTRACWHLGLLLFFCAATIQPLQTLGKDSVTLLPAGTRPNQTASKEWNRIILLAQPRIASGDVDALSTSIRNTVSSFVLSILATVEPYQDTASGMQKYRLADVGIGYSAFINDEWRVITSATQSKLGAKLGFIGGQMLKTNEAQLATARMVAKTSTIFVFDTPSLMFRGGKHVKLVTRHFVWIDSKTGKSSTLVWLIQEDSQGQWSIVDEPLRWVPAGAKEDRRVHVDGDEFLLGIPNERAFALEDLPPGKPVPWTTQAQSLAANKTFDSQSLRTLTLALNECLQSLRK